MAEPRIVLAIDQGTTSTRAMLFDGHRALASAQRELSQIYPADGWVEHDPEEIWRATLAVAGEALAQARVTAAKVGAIGIANQRETTVVWERASGRPIHNAIVWQDRRGAPLCRRLIDEGLAPTVQEKTGLVIDSYFSASKIAWLLDNVAGARHAAERGRLAFGTIDSFLLWRLTAGRVHATDATNASRSMLFDIRRQDWDDGLLAALGIPRTILPEVKDSAGPFGATEAGLFDRALPVTGIAGDQQAALVGQACFAPGFVKSTYGTGCFLLAHVGDEPVLSRNRLLTTVAYRLGGRAAYALEGSIFIAGAAVQWLRDRLGLIESAAESESLAAGAEDNGSVYLVPAFTGLGAPYWDPAARGAIFGLTRDTGRADLARAALAAVGYQTRDLMNAIVEDTAGRALSALRVDGGMARNDWAMQFLADILGVPVERPAVTETTALGAAYLAGLGAGLIASTEEVARHWRRERLFEPRFSEDRRQALYAGWQRAVAQTRGMAGGSR